MSTYATDALGRIVSEDGKWVWDGTEWKPNEAAVEPEQVIEATPEPETPTVEVSVAYEPVVSEDGKWVWDGTEWKPNEAAVEPEQVIETDPLPDQEPEEALDEPDTDADEPVYAPDLDEPGSYASIPDEADEPARTGGLNTRLIFVAVAVVILIPLLDVLYLPAPGNALAPIALIAAQVIAVGVLAREALR